VKPADIPVEQPTKFDLRINLTTATSRYPDWWQGRRFDKPTIAWVAGVTCESTRDNPQRILLGRSGQHGTGAIPKDAIANASRCLGNPAFRPATFRAPAREFRLYHRDGGKVVKLRDDLISAIPNQSMVS
jgi:hypothetical protein